MIVCFSDKKVTFVTTYALRYLDRRTVLGLIDGRVVDREVSPLVTLTLLHAM